MSDTKISSGHPRNTSTQAANRFPRTKVKWPEDQTHPVAKEIFTLVMEVANQLLQEGMTLDAALHNNACSETVDRIKALLVALRPIAGGGSIGDVWSAQLAAAAPWESYHGFATKALLGKSAALGLDTFPARVASLDALVTTHAKQLKDAGIALMPAMHKSAKTTGDRATLTYVEASLIHDLMHTTDPTALRDAVQPSIRMLRNRNMNEKVVLHRALLHKTYKALTNK